MALDINIKNNLFRKAGAVGANILSARLNQEIKEALFDKIGENNIISIGGFLGSQTASLIRRLLFTKPGQHGHYDPVWKLTTFTAPAEPELGLPAGNIARATADDFAGADHPKYKFMYTVSFNYRSSILDTIRAGTSPENARAMQGANTLKEIAFGLKTASRPNPTVAYQDVNFYNYRTKIATKIDFGTLNLTFYDDVNNRAHDIVAAYLKTISPIARVSNPAYANFLDTLGISPMEDDPDVSGIGILANGEEAGLINSITITHHLPIQYSSSATESNSVMNTKVFPAVRYIFFNPKIININLDDLDMTQSDTSTVSMTLTYDSVYMDKVSTTESLEEVITTGSSETALDKFLRGIDNAINPLLNSAQDRINQLNDSTLLNNVRDFIF